MWEAMLRAERARGRRSMMVRRVWVRMMV